MILNKKLMDDLSAQAKANPRLRQSYDLRTEATEACPEPGRRDNSQRMLNALEPGTIMPIHRHRNSSETMVMVRGKLIERFYDDDGNITDEFVMEPLVAEQGRNTNITNSSNNSEHSTTMVQIEAGRWHSLEVLEEGTVIFEAKDGAYATIVADDIMLR